MSAPDSDPPSIVGGLSADEQRYYGDGAWYDAEYVHIRGDIPYYSQIARETAGPILELACGTGRLTFPMADENPSVLGMDCSTGMLEQARSKQRCLPDAQSARLRFIEGDMRSFALGERFAAIVLAFDTIRHLIEDEELAGCLHAVHTHLAPGGLFYLDLMTPHPGHIADREPEGRYDPQEMIDPRSGERYVVSENNHYDPRRQINTMCCYYQQVDRRDPTRRIGGEREVQLRLRVLFPRELELWLKLGGFSIVSDHNDFERTTPFDGRGGRRVLALRAT